MEKNGRDLFGIWFNSVKRKKLSVFIFGKQNTVFECPLSLNTTTTNTTTNNNNDDNKDDDNNNKHEKKEIHSFESGSANGKHLEEEEGGDQQGTKWKLIGGKL